MVDYSNLPSEIRQRILKLTLPNPDDLEIEKVEPLVRLSLVNKQAWADVKELSSSYAPVYVVKKPTRREWPMAQAGFEKCVLPPASSVCFFLFGGENPSDLMWWEGFVAPAGLDEPERCRIMSKWKDRLQHLLPPQVKTVLLDATPATAFMRRKDAAWVASMVHDSRVRRFCLEYHQPCLVQLIKEIYTFCNDTVRILLVGTFAPRCQPWLRILAEDCQSVGVDIQIVAKFVEKPPKTKAPDAINEAFRDFYQSERRLGLQHAERCTVASRMIGRRWRSTTQDLFTSCQTEYPQWSAYVMDKLLDFLADAQLATFDLRPGGPDKRKLVHRMAEDLGLYTETIGEEPQRYVRLSRAYIARPWERAGELETSVNSETA